MSTGKPFTPRSRTAGSARNRSFSGGTAPAEGADASFHKIQQVLQGALKQYGLDEDIARYKFVTHWAEIVGESIAQRTKPECIRSGQLVVRVTDSAWAQELSFRRQAIIKRLQRFLENGETVTDVRFYVGQLPR